MDVTLSRRPLQHREHRQLGRRTANEFALRLLIEVELRDRRLVRGDGEP